MEETVDIDNINDDDDDTIVCSDKILNNNLNGKQN